MVYIQAKRQQDNVNVHFVRDFTGALTAKGALKGIFITTSDFTKAAKKFVEAMTAKKVILINGNQLAQFMIDHKIGISIEKTYEIKRVNSDYFAENAE